MNEIKLQTVSTSTVGSKVPLDKLSCDKETSHYDPFAHRKVPLPTTDSETLFHLIKASLGAGILAMPLAFANGGIWFGLVNTFIVGIICTYCVQILVKCSYRLCRRIQVPSLTYADIAETAFATGPQPLHKWSRCARFVINAFIVMNLLGFCIVFNSLVATNVKQVVEQYYPGSVGLDLRWYILMLLPLLIPINMIRNLKHLVPFSVVANLLLAACIVISIYYTCISDKTRQFEFPSSRDRPAIGEFYRIPMFFGTVIFALEGVGVVMSLENNMKNPQHFIGCPGVLNTGMALVACLYAIVGFLGYAKYGENTAVSITLNLPVKDVLAQSVKLSIAVALFFSYALQFYVPMEIIWKGARDRFSERNKNMAEYTIRAISVAGTIAIAIAIPNIGPFISLVGAVCLSTLGLIFPSVIEIITYYERPGFGKFRWILWKNLLLILFGITSFLTGTYVSVLEIYNDFK